MTPHDPAQILSAILPLIQDYIQSAQEKKRKVTYFDTKEHLQSQVNLSFGEQGKDSKELIGLISTIFKHSVATQHPRFFNQLYAGSDIYSIIGELLSAILNTSMATYEIAPLFTCMEEELFHHIQTLLGRDEAVGFLLPGGSMSNLYGVHFARHHLDPAIKTAGVSASAPFVVFNSDQGHYSLDKAAIVMGIGRDQVWSIRSDEQGRMDTHHLELRIQEALQKGLAPLLINATAGTTVFGAFDPLQDISSIAKKYSIRLHVDAALGGSVIIDPSLRHHLEGIEQADSFSRNPHKLLGATQQASVFMTRHNNTAQTCNTVHADYLFNTDKGYGNHADTGDFYLQCGRKSDILKIWLQRTMLGQDMLRQRIRHSFNLSQYLAQRIQESKHLVLVQNPISTNVCFWFLPPDIHKTSINHESLRTTYFDRIHHLTADIKTRMLEQGEMMCTYTPAKGLPNFFRMVINNPLVTTEDIDFVIKHIEEIGLAL